ncbi:MAG: IS630 family transposase [Pseudomonadota bacterium]
MTGKSLSLDIGQRVVALVDEGLSCREAARRLRISAASAVRIMQRKKSTGGVNASRQGRPRRSKLDAVSDWLNARVEAEPDITMPELAEALRLEHDLAATSAMLSRHLIHRLGLTYKKSLIATERLRKRVRAARYEWRHRRMPSMRLEPHRLVFIDETAVTTKMTRLRGRSPQGTRLEAEAPFGHWRTQTFIAGLRIDELSAPCVLDGPLSADLLCKSPARQRMNRAAFDAYIETQLAPTLQPGDVVIADNLSSHKSAQAHNVLKVQGNWMLFLPPYSPDLNPIEMTYSKLKAHLRRLKARTFDALFQSVALTCQLFPPQECRNFFKAAGYVTD